jgi:biopolymer transport protein ExbD
VNIGRATAMLSKIIGRSVSRDGVRSLNLTPIIDIVFLLIIFFLVVCQFIEAENFPVTVPDDCRFAQSDPRHQGRSATVTVMKTKDQGIAFAVGSDKTSASGNADAVVEKLTELINASVGDLPVARRVVTLRIDKDICFADAQYALAAVAASTATDIQFAVSKDRFSGAK